LPSTVILKRWRASSHAPPETLEPTLHGFAIRSRSQAATQHQSLRALRFASEMQRRGDRVAKGIRLLQQRRLDRRQQSRRVIGAKGRARLVDPERAEVSLSEEALIAAPGTTARSALGQVRSPLSDLPRALRPPASMVAVPAVKIP
jgi:hypothetical protein